MSPSPLSGRAHGPQAGAPPAGGHTTNFTPPRRFNRRAQQDRGPAILRRCVALRRFELANGELGEQNFGTTFGISASAANRIQLASRKYFTLLSANFGGRRNLGKLRQKAAFPLGNSRRNLAPFAFWKRCRCFGSKAVCSQRRISRTKSCCSPQLSACRVSKLQARTWKQYRLCADCQLSPHAQ
jgi:hypothetical protein